MQLAHKLIYGFLLIAGKISIKKNFKDKDHSYLSPTLQFDYETKRVMD